MIAALLAAKLNRPSTPPRSVPRPSLLSRLNDGLAGGRQITLISAPAGYGKTTCATEWLNSLDMPAAWLSLDEADDDPGRFFTYLVAALQTVDDTLGSEIEGVLRAGQLPPGEIISTTLSNDVLQTGKRFLLVLDDFHLIEDSFILQVLEDLIDNLPESLHLVLLTRKDPPLSLARLRANSRLTEIRAADLRFTQSEAGQLFNEMMDLSLPQADISALEERTEGWIAGLHLAGLSIRGRDNPSTFIANLSGSHRFILSYLSEEVLNRQTEDVQHFLQQTSILERLNGDLCDAVTGRSNSSSLLEDLLEANLFLTPLDDERQWYRYHGLFAGLLRDRQNASPQEETAELQRRACQWYVQQGMVSEAIEHALHGEEYATAVQLIETHAMDMLMQWHLKTVNRWLDSIPAAWTAQSPRANLAFAWMHLMRGDFALAAPYLERLPALFSSPREEEVDTSVQAKWLALQTMLLNARGQPQESVNLAKQALAIAPTDDDQVLSMIYLGLASAYQQMDDYEQARDAFQMIIQHGRAVGNSVYELLGVSGLALLVLQHGGYHQAHELVTQAIERSERAGLLPPISTALYGELGVIYYQWFELEKAHDYFLRAIQISTLSGYSDAELYYGVILSRLLHMKGDLAAAAREINKAVNLMQVEKPSAVREEVVSQQVRIYLAQSRLAEVERILGNEGFSFDDGFSYPGLDTRQNIIQQHGNFYLSALRTLLYREEVSGQPESLKPGIELANLLIHEATQRGYIPFALETRLLRAKMLAAMGDNEASMADLTTALSLGKQEGLITFFVEEGPAVARAITTLLENGRLGLSQTAFAKQILAAFSQAQASGAADIDPVDRQPGPDTDKAEPLIDPLTERELDVLRLMAEGQKYEEIAQSLIISVNTVRSHVKAIYGKLDVNNRTKAIERAQQSGLL